MIDPHPQLGGQDRPADAIKCLKSNGLHTVWLIQPPGEPPRTLKTWPLDAMLMVKLALGIAQPQRQIRGAERLARAGIPTPRCLGSWRVAKRGGRRVVELIIEYVPGCTALDWLQTSADKLDAERALLIRSARIIGGMVLQFADAGLFHRDLKPSNIVIDVDSEPAPRIWFIDPVGVRPMRRRLPEIERMLERLALAMGRLDSRLAAALRAAVLRAATRPLSPADRREIFRLMRLRIADPSVS